jgi:hypothetical protein
MMTMMMTTTRSTMMHAHLMLANASDYTLVPPPRLPNGHVLTELMMS